MSFDKDYKDEKYWHVRTVDEVFSELGSSKEGLSTQEATRRLKEVGENRIAKDEKFDWVKSLLSKANNLLIYVLLAASIISLLAGDVLEFVIILLIVFLTVFLGFYQEFKADQTMKALSKLTAKYVDVIRDGEKKSILADELVPGDIVSLERGSIVPADMRVIQDKGLLLDESILTGESVLKSKITDQLKHHNIPPADRDNILFSGTSVTKGSGRGVVVETGLNSEIGKISSELTSIGQRKSHLQQKVDSLSKRISYIVLTFALIIFTIMTLQGEGLYATLILVAALAVAGIPEAFPLVLTLSLTRGIKRMASKNAVIKELNAVETLGTTSVICSDKTGTLTENKMRVSKIYFPTGDEFSVVGSGYEPRNSFYYNGEKVSYEKLLNRRKFFEGSVLCSEAELDFNEEEWILKGEPTEGALLSLAKSVGVDDVVEREQKKRVHEIPFDPAHKYMITVNKNQNSNCYVSYLKGAAERVLEMSSYYRDNKGKLHKLDKSLKESFLKQVDNYSSEGLRVLFLASKDIKSDKKLSTKDLENNIYSDYVFEGLVGIEDPIRSDVYDAVKDCFSAGIRVIMITGDYKTTARRIGEELGFINSEHNVVIDGSEIENLTDEEIDGLIDDIAVVSRATPEHKLRIVNSLQRKDKIVAMTGDGVNDAPALKKANIGISMGRDGTEVAKEASEIVLTDDNFATIVGAVKEGRTIYSNIRRFIYYLLTGNFTEIILIGIAVLFAFHAPLTAIMVLFINLVTSSIPAMALSIEPTHSKVMKQLPRNSKERLLSKYMVSKILVILPIIVIGTLSLYLWELFVLESSTSHAMTVAFATVIAFKLLHTFNARSLHSSIFDKNFFNNGYIFLSVLVSFSLLLLAIYTNTGNEIFGTVPIDLIYWPIILGASSIVIFFSELIKFNIKMEFEEQKSMKGIDSSFKLE